MDRNTTARRPSGEGVSALRRTMVGWVCVLSTLCVGCASPIKYHFFHYHQPFEAVARNQKPYFHSRQTGRIIEKDPCQTYREPACFGYEPTCWTAWPVDCPDNCPVPTGEMILEHGVVISEGLAVPEGQIIHEAPMGTGIQPAPTEMDEPGVAEADEPDSAEPTPDFPHAVPSETAPSAPSVEPPSLDPLKSSRATPSATPQGYGRENTTRSAAARDSADSVTGSSSLANRRLWAQSANRVMSGSNPRTNAVETQRLQIESPVAVLPSTGSRADFSSERLPIAEETERPARAERSTPLTAEVTSPNGTMVAQPGPSRVEATRSPLFSAKQQTTIEKVRPQVAHAGPLSVAMEPNDSEPNDSEPNDSEPNDSEPNDSESNDPKVDDLADSGRNPDRFADTKLPNSQPADSMVSSLPAGSTIRVRLTDEPSVSVRASDVVVKGDRIASPTRSGLEKLPAAGLSVQSGSDASDLRFAEARAQAAAESAPAGPLTREVLVEKAQSLDLLTKVHAVTDRMQVALAPVAGLFTAESIDSDNWQKLTSESAALSDLMGPIGISPSEPTGNLTLGGILPPVSISTVPVTVDALAEAAMPMVFNGVSGDLASAITLDSQDEMTTLSFSDRSSRKIVRLQSEEEIDETVVRFR